MTLLQVRQRSVRTRCTLRNSIILCNSDAIAIALHRNDLIPCCAGSGSAVRLHPLPMEACGTLPGPYARIAMPFVTFPGLWSHTQVCTRFVVQAWH